MEPKTLPTLAAVGNLLTMLVGRKVNVKAATALAVPAARGVATYMDAAEQVHYVALSDMAFLAGVGAALAMIPPAVVSEAIKAGKPSSVLLENAFEVMNVFSSLFNDEEGKGTHVKIQRLEVVPPVAREIGLRIAKPGKRIDLDVQLPGYADGKLTLLALT